MMPDRFVRVQGSDKSVVSVLDSLHVPGCNVTRSADQSKILHQWISSGTDNVLGRIAVNTARINDQACMFFDQLIVKGGVIRCE